MKKASSDSVATPKTVSTDKLLPRLTLNFFNRPRITALLWVCLTIFGVLSYTTFLKREGFPSVAIPIVIVDGTYAVNNAATVDSALAAPISQDALKQPGVSMVQTESGPNFFSATLQYGEKTNAADAKKALQTALDADSRIPAKAKLTLAAPYFGVTGGSTTRVDATISVFSTQSRTNLQGLVAKSQQAVDYLNAHKPPQVASYSVADPFQSISDPATGISTTVQKTFDRYGQRDGNTNTFHQSVIIDVASINGADVIKLDNQIRASLATYQTQPEAAGISMAVSASYAPSIKNEISELQRVLLEGLVAVLVVGSIIIAIRASLITVLSMLTVITITLGIIYLLGYTLNVISLFALILGLSLIVDDTIIMVEAIDSARRKTDDKRLAVATAIRKISRAMVAATLTAALSFTPLLFVSGVLGSFIRAIPVTIISALLTSLCVALIFIPLFARYLLLGKKQMKKVGSVAADHPINGVSGFEAKMARTIVRPMLWARHSRSREFTIGLTAILIGLIFIGTGGFMFTKVAFNIFPPAKDTDQLAVVLTFKPGTTVPQAEAIAAQADKLTSQVLGADFLDGSYYGTGDNQTATLNIDLKDYSKRSETAPQLADALKASFKNFSAAQVTAYPVGVGPPTSPFKVDITATNRLQAEQLASNMAQYLKGQKLKRSSGKIATITDTSISNTDIYERSGTRPIISVTASFDGTDTTTLTGLAETAVKNHYTNGELARYGLKTSDVTFDLGQEASNQDSFKSLAIAFPIVLIAIYVLLLIQFRSLLQPLLIFMALPFSIFGISLGLYYTNNAISFFSLLGFFALIGLSIKNTILLTDYANQARRAGLPAVDAVGAALGERFRPLVATSLTAVVSLIPLAVTSPFWQSLAVTLIFGLLSSTLLVIVVFPYFYLGAEYLRLKISRTHFLLWLVGNISLVAIIARLVGPSAAVMCLGIFNAVLVISYTVRLLAAMRQRPKVV